MALAKRRKGYLIDACTLISWIPIILGMDPEDAEAREWIWEAFRRRLFKITKTVAAEVFANSPRLGKELIKRGVEIIIPSKDLVAKAKAKRRKYLRKGRIVGAKCVDDNDMIFIFIAEFEEMIVVTQEARREGRLNIPAVCKELGVPCLSSADLRSKLKF